MPISSLGAAGAYNTTPSTHYIQNNQQDVQTKKIIQALLLLSQMNKGQQPGQNQLGVA